MYELDWNYTSSMEYDRAMPLFEERLVGQKAKLGPDHPETLVSMNNLASAYQAFSSLRGCPDQCHQVGSMPVE
jgi:hypothetical protein